MPKQSTQPSLFAPSSVTALDEQHQDILRRLGLDALPTHETRWLPLARIRVPGEEKVRVPKSLIHSIRRFGILQAPSVVRCSLLEEADEQAIYEVIAGRRRTKAARLAGLTVLKVEDYATSTPQLSALLALIENTQRSAAWVKEVTDLRLLVDQRVGMTIQDLTACGFTRAGLTERLKMARLPAPLFDQIAAGTVPLEAARRLVRLGEAQLARIVQVAQGEPLTTDLITQALRAQITPASSPAQSMLPSLEMLTLPATAPVSHLEEESATRAPEYVSLIQVVTTLRAFTQSDAYRHLEDSHLLIQALLQRLEIAAREQTQPVPHLLAS